MPTHDKAIEIAVDDQHIAGTLVMPATMIPGVLLVHGWGGNQEQYVARAREIAVLGCICLTFDLRGHARDEQEHEHVTREDNLHDVVAAYDLLAGQRLVDRHGDCGRRQQLRRLSGRDPDLAAARAMARPACSCTLPGRGLGATEAAARPRGSRRIPATPGPARGNRALPACADFKGDVLVAKSEHDEVVPHPAVASFLGAFTKAHSLTHRVIEGADHGLVEQTHQKAYTALLVRWATEMVLGARQGDEQCDRAGRSGRFLAKGGARRGNPRGVGAV